MASKPLVLPGRHLVNGSLLGANALSMGAFLTMAPTAPMVAAGFLGMNTLLSFIKGYTLTAAVGGADMREYALSVTWFGRLTSPNISRGNYRTQRVFWICSGRRRFHARQSLANDGWVTDWC